MVKINCMFAPLSFIGIEEQAAIIDDEIQPLLNLHIHFEQFHPRSSNAIRSYFLSFCACSKILNEVHCASCLKLAGELKSSLVSRPSEGKRGEKAWHPLHAHQGV